MSTTADPVARVLRGVAVVVGVAGLVVLVVGVTAEARRPAKPVTAKTLALSVGDGVGSAFPDQTAECRGGRGGQWGCLIGDSDGSGGATYDVALRGRCWTAVLVTDASERHDTPRRAHGCVPRR